MNFPFRLLPRFLFALAVLVLATILCAPPIILIGIFPSSGYATYRLACLWALIVSKGMALTFSISGTEKIQPGASYIITPNHQSNTDILALFLSMPTPFRWVIKKQLLNVPLFGWALGSTGAIALDRSNRESAVNSLRKAKEKLGGGWSVLIYPEGTRTPDGNLLPFKKGAFMTAVQTGIPILPVTCNGAYKIMSRHTIMLRPGHITLTVGDPIPTHGLTEADVPELMEKTRAEISRHLDSNYDPFTAGSGNLPGN